MDNVETSQKPWYKLNTMQVMSCGGFFVRFFGQEYSIFESLDNMNLWLKHSTLRVKGNNLRVFSKIHDSERIKNAARVLIRNFTA